MDEYGWYQIGFAIVGFIAFICVWIYAIASWGFLLGVAFGWFPAMIVAVIVGALWPLVLLGVGVIALIIIGA